MRCENASVKCTARRANLGSDVVQNVFQECDSAPEFAAADYALHAAHVLAPNGRMSDESAGERGKW